MKCRERFQVIFRKEDDEKALKDAAAATAASMVHQDQVAASSTNPDTTAHAGAVPMNVEFPKDAVVPETSTGGAASSSMGQFVDNPVGMEISEADLKRSESEEVPENRNVRRIHGLAVCSRDIVGAAQADYDNPQLSREEFERKVDEESDAVHTHEGEPMESFEIPISERDIIGVKSGVVLDPVKVQAARQKEIDSIARHEVVELVRTSECKQGGAHVKGDFVDDNKGDIVRSCFVAKQVAYDPRDDVSQSTSALPVFRQLLSIAVSDALVFGGSPVVLSVWDNRWHSSTR